MGSMVRRVGASALLFVRSVAGMLPALIPEWPYGIVRVVNMCDADARVSTKQLVEDAMPDAADFVLPGLHYAELNCVNVRRVRVHIEAVPGALNRACDVYSPRMSCLGVAWEHVVRIECDETSPFACTATDQSVPCAVSSADARALCPAYSTPLGGDAYGADEYSCSGEHLVVQDGAYFDAGSYCPVCVCDAGTKCVGSECGACGPSEDYVSRVVDASCVPVDWTRSGRNATRPLNTPPPLATPRPVLIPTLGPTPLVAPTPPPYNSKRRARRASSMAVLIIAILAGGIAACAIRQAVVKQRRQRRATAGLYVDIPSNDISLASYQREPPGRRASRKGGSVEMMVHGNEGL